MASFVLIKYKLNDVEPLESVTSAPSPLPSGLPAGTESTNPVWRTPSLNAAEKATAPEKRSPHRASTLSSFPFLTKSGTPASLLPSKLSPSALLSTLLRDTSTLVTTHHIHMHRVHVLPAVLAFLLRRPEADACARAVEDELMVLLERCHGACAKLSIVGFLLQMIGILSFAWAAFDRSVSIFASACVAGSVGFALVAMR